MKDSSENNEIRLNHELKNLQDRIKRIEEHLNLQPFINFLSEDKQSTISEEPKISSENLEFRIGQYWLAKSGIIILAIGIAFLLTFPYENLPKALPSILGYVLVSVLFVISHLWQKPLAHISGYLMGGALILLYFTTLRLHFFSDVPAVDNRNLEIALLSLVVVTDLGVSAYKKSIFLTGISLTLGYITAIIGDSAYFLFFLSTILAATSVYFKIKHQWHSLYLYCIMLTYFIHFLWFLNNPLLNKPMAFVSSPDANLYFLIIYALIFAFGNLFRDKNIAEDNPLVMMTFFNCAGSIGLLLIISVFKFQHHIFTSHLTASIIFLLLSVAFWLKEKSKVSTFFYAICGYGMLSVAIVSQFENPEFFIWLSWQSLLVISTAIWYRSKFIIGANFIIFITIFISFLSLSAAINFTSLSFAFVAMISARILNWQKNRLELKTEIMRNAYLASTFFMFPYSLYHLVPEKFVSLSWISVALLYYILSRLLQNRKYRWMALATLLLTVSYTLGVGIIRLDPGYRIVSFIVLGLVLLATSLIYTKVRNKSSTETSGLE